MGWVQWHLLSWCTMLTLWNGVALKSWRDMRIAAAAIMKDGEVYSLPPPARHHDVLRHMVTLGLQQTSGDEQGFLTECGEFVRRKPALMIAEHAGQLNRKQGPGTYQGPELFSEDVW